MKYSLKTGSVVHVFAEFCHDKEQIKATEIRNKWESGTEHLVIGSNLEPTLGYQPSEI